MDSTRKKRFTRKAKTGCITCRIRKIKCDEEKPSCHRCRSTGRKCDGYDSPTNAVSPDPDTALSLLPGSTEEQRSFQFFSTYSATQFAGLFDSTFWTEGVLQASHVNPTIRHAVSALGVLHAKFLTNNLPVVPKDVSDKELQFALKLCNRSIERLMTHHSDDPETILTACILFVTFASIQGHQLQAMNHLRGGLRLLNGIDVSDMSSDDDNKRREHASPIQLQTLRNMFISFNTQARSMLNSEMLASWSDGLKFEPIPPPTALQDVETAQSFADWLHYNSLYFAQKMDIAPPEDMFMVTSRHQYLEQQLALHKDLVAEFVTRRGEMLNERERVSVMRISIYHHMSTIFLYLSKNIIFPAPTYANNIGLLEETWDNLELECAAIVELARKILTSSLVDGSSKRPTFSVGLGVVMPLFLVATRCRHSRIRREAVQLLLEYPRREGIWDSSIAGKIAARGIEIEEEGARLHAELTNGSESAATIPEFCRIRNFEIVYLGDRKAEVTYWTTSQFLNAGVGLRSVIEW